jgi:hypothetical protein
MGLRELKEAAHQQYVRGKFAQCAQTYQQILRLAPKDPNMRVRHAEACRRAGDAVQAIASYRAAAALLLELRCESRARGALKAALELDPNDLQLQAEVARLGPQHDEPLTFQEEPEEPAVAPVPVLPPLARPQRAALPPIHRALPAVRPATPPPVMRPVGTIPPPVLPTAMASALPPRTGAMNQPVQAPRSAAPPVLQPREDFSAALASSSAAPMPGARAASPAHRNQLALPMLSQVGLIDSPQEVALPPPASRPVAAATGKDSKARLEVRRLSPSALAFRNSHSGTWAVIRSQAPIEMHLVNSLEQLPPLPRDAATEPQTKPENGPPQAAMH